MYYFNGTIKTENVRIHPGLSAGGVGRGGGQHPAMRSHGDERASRNLRPGHLDAAALGVVPLRSRKFRNLNFFGSGGVFFEEAAGGAEGAERGAVHLSGAAAKESLGRRGDSACG